MLAFVNGLLILSGFCWFLIMVGVQDNQDKDSAIAYGIASCMFIVHIISLCILNA